MHYEYRFIGKLGGWHVGKWRVYIACIFIDLTPLGLQQFNKSFFNSRVGCQEYQVTGKAADGHTRYSTGFKVYLTMEEGPETISCDEGFWNTVVVGKRVKICKARGAFGFYYIREMEVD